MLTILAEAAPAVESLPAILSTVSGGSFLAVIIWLVPKVFAHIDAQRAGFEKALQSQQESHQSMLKEQISAQRDERRDFTASLDRNSEAVSELTKTVQSQLKV